MSLKQLADVNLSPVLDRFDNLDKGISANLEQQKSLVDSFKIVTDKIESDKKIQEQADKKKAEDEKNAQEQQKSVEANNQSFEDYKKDLLDSVKDNDQQLKTLVSDQRDFNKQLNETMTNGFYFMGAVIVFSISLNAFMRRFLS
ncbi:hypothetical protein NE294_10855 [Latilactobacillus curvatus]|nr:hypothetical protein [Latilactobacillus curvatus]MCM6869481.1 hypothetical protein [Latilactobacillus curvatus]